MSLLIAALLVLPTPAAASCGCGEGHMELTSAAVRSMRLSGERPTTTGRRHLRRQVKNRMNTIRRQFLRPTDPRTLQMKTYQSSTHSLRINYPSDWSVHDGFFGTVVSLISPHRGTKDRLTENVNVIVRALEEELTLTAATEAAIGELRTLPNFVLLDSKDATLSSLPAHSLTYTSGNGADLLKFRQVWTIANNALYVFTFAADPRDYDDYARIFDRMLQSLWIGTR